VADTLSRLDMADFADRSMGTLSGGEGGGMDEGLMPLTEGERAQDTAIVLPLYHQMTADEQDRVIESLARAVAS